jgi:hypothetical protein
VNLHLDVAALRPPEFSKFLPEQRALPSTPAPDPDGGMGMKVTFQREIVWPDGHREIEDVTPKQLPAPTSNALPRPTNPTDDTNEGAV